MLCTAQETLTGHDFAIMLLFDNVTQETDMQQQAAALKDSGSLSHPKGTNSDCQQFIIDQLGNV